jgi:hypothetical protein
MRTIVALLTVVVLLRGVAPARAAQEQEPVKELRAIYFGNSLTACAQPSLHEPLGKSAGKTWQVDLVAGAGWQVNFHWAVLLGAGIDAGDRGDLTIDPEVAAKYKNKVRKFTTQKYDAMVLQPFHAPLKFMKTEHMGLKFDRPTDCGELRACIDLIAMYLERNPGGVVYIYQNWPNMQAGPVPPEGDRPDWAKVPGARLKGAEFPLREQFDYEHEWLELKYSPDHPDRPWLDNLRCQDLFNQLFEGCMKAYPELWKEGRLRAIPVGDVWMALHRKMKAGEVPGFENISDFYTDVQHIRIGLPRYSVAATFYAVMFRDDPHKLDWKVYNTKEAFMSKYDKPHYDLNHDKGELIAITEETAKIVNDTIVDVITGHPYAQIAEEE